MTKTIRCLPGFGEVLIKVVAAGLCHSDLSVINGDRPRPMPMALGYEAAGIVQSVQSLLSLRYPHHDVVCVDDGSTDGTGALLDRMAADGTLTVLHQPNRGRFAARLAGLVVLIEVERAPALVRAAIDLIEGRQA